MRKRYTQIKFILWNHIFLIHQSKQFTICKKKNINIFTTKYIELGDISIIILIF